MRPISSPGSITTASPLASSPKIEQLHFSSPTSRISWIMIVYSNYGPNSARGARDLRAMDSHRFSGYVDRRLYLCALRAGPGAGFASNRGARAGGLEYSEQFSSVADHGSDHRNWLRDV